MDKVVQRLKLALIGMGNMASAIAEGTLRSGYLEGKNVIGYDPFPANLDRLAGEYGVIKANTAREAAAMADVIVLAVKPNKMESVINELGDTLKDKGVVSIALGWNYEKLYSVLPGSARIQSVMPNTPMLVGEGVCLFEDKTTLNAGEQEFLKGLFESIGIVRTLPSYLMNAGGTISGCGPAFIYMFLEAMGDAGVYHGVPRADAYALAAQTMIGAAKMVLETGEHPGLLKDKVCSPGGATIRGVAALEECGFRAAVIEAVHQGTGE